MKNIKIRIKSFFTLQKGVKISISVICAILIRYIYLYIGQIDIMDISNHLIHTIIGLFLIHTIKEICFFYLKNIMPDASSVNIYKPNVSSINSVEPDTKLLTDPQRNIEKVKERRNNQMQILLLITLIIILLSTVLYML